MVKLLEKVRFRVSYMGAVDYVFGEHVPGIGLPTVSCRREASHYHLTIANGADYFLNSVLKETGCITWEHHGDEFPPDEVISIFKASGYDNVAKYRLAKHLPEFELKGEPITLVMDHRGFYPDFALPDPELLGDILWRGTADQMSKQLYRELFEQHLPDHWLYEKVMAKLA